MIPLVVNGLWSAVVLTCVPNAPKDIGIETEESREADAKAFAAGKSKPDEAAPIGIVQAFLLPNVMGYALAFGFFKLTNYAMFFQVRYWGFIFFRTQLRVPACYSAACTRQHFVVLLRRLFSNLLRHRFLSSFHLFISVYLFLCDGL